MTLPFPDAESRPESTLAPETHPLGDRPLKDVDLSPAYPGRAPRGTAQSLRAWQAAALTMYLENGPSDFLAVATPGAGKTTFALRVAAELLADRVVERVIVVAPTEHLKVQWADAAARAGIQIDPGLGSGKKGRSKQYKGVAVTYAGVAIAPHRYEALANQFKTLVILDEVHHAGDALSWGDAVRDCFKYATRRLMLTGTPFRSDANPIPFVTYDEQEDGTKVSRADYTYGYADALADHVVRPVIFMAYGGQMRWRTKAGDELEMQLAEPSTKDLTAHAWRTALDPKGEWISAVLRAADARLTQVRHAVPDAGGLVIATDQTVARAYARLLTDITGEKPTTVLSDDVGASKKIEEFSQSDARWMVAVRMVSEGVDVPRLSVGVYATSTSTPLFFAQAVGRFVRTRRRGEVATVFLPTVPVILAHASLLEMQRNHILGKPKQDDDGLWNPEEALMEAANRKDSSVDYLEGTFEALSSTANFDHVMFDSQQYGLQVEPNSAEEEEWLGLPGLLEPDQVSTLLKARQRRQLARQAKRDKKDHVPDEVALHRALEAKRKELNGLVAQYARTRGVPHAHVHAELRRECGGPKLATATDVQVDRRIEEIRKWFKRGKRIGQ